MPTVITQRQLRNASGEIMRRLDAGERFIVTRNGVPVGELTPHRPNRFLPSEIASELFRTSPAVDVRRLREELDARLDQRLHA